MTATVACVFIVDMCDSDGINESIIITAVIRRKDSDLYYYTISSYCRCEDQETFMVEERACTKNEDLLKGEYMHTTDLWIVQYKIVQTTMVHMTTRDLEFTWRMAHLS